MVRNSSDKRKEFLKEAKRIEEDILYSEKSNFILSNYWKYCNNILGILIISCSIIAGTFAFSNFKELNITIGILTVFITCISMIQIFLNPSEKSVFNQNIGTRYNELRRQIRIFYNTEIDMQSDEENLEQIKCFSNEKIQIDKDSSNIPGFVYKEAKKSIEKNEHEYVVDINT